MYFSKLGAVGVNYARLWLTDSGWDDLAVEIAVANFSLPNTWSVYSAEIILYVILTLYNVLLRRLDYVVELAEHKGIHLLMCTESFNYFCTRITGELVVVMATTVAYYSGCHGNYWSPIVVVMVTCICFVHSTL